MGQIQRYQNNVMYSEPYGAPGPQAQNEMSGREQLNQVLDILQRGKWIIVATFVVAIGVSIAYVYMQDPSYQATSLVMLSNDRSSQQSSQMQMLQMANPNSQWGRSTESELLLLRNSQELPLQVVDRIRQLPDEYDRQLRPLTVSASGDSLTDQQLARRISARVRFGSSGSLIQIHAVTPSQGNAPLLSNLFATEYVEFTKEISRSSLVASREFLEQQLDDQEQELDAIEQRIANALREKGTTSVDAEGSALLSKISQMEAQRDRVEIELQRRQATVDALRSNLEEIRPQLAQSIGSTVSQEIDAVQQKLADLKAQRQLSMLNNPEWEDPNTRPELRTTNRQIRMLQDKLAELSENYVGEMISSEGTRADSSMASEGLSRAVSLKQQIATEQIAMTGLQAEQEAVTEQIERYQAELESVPGESIQMQKLQRERERVARMYDFITQRLQEIRIREQGEQGYASVIAQATSVSPTQPGGERTLILGAFFGLMLGMGLALLRYKMDSRIYKPDQVEQMGFETTIVPDIAGLVGSGKDGTALVERNGKQLPASLVTVHDASSHATEAYRQLRTNIQFGLNEEGSNVVVVTSPGVGEGKSTTAANLAVAFAQAGYRTLLMDGDMRRPQVHRLMGRSLEPGLFQLLQGDLSISPARLETHIGNLFAIPAGRLAGGSAAEVTGGRNMRTLVSSLRDHFDIIIIDTPPTLAVAEARQLAPKADATLMVVRAGSTRENELGFAIEQLERVGARVMGVVLNGFDMSMAYGYEYRYQQYVHYGTEDADMEDADVEEAGTAQPEAT